YVWGSRGKTGELMKLTSERDVLRTRLESSAELMKAQSADYEQRLQEQGENKEQQLANQREHYEQQLAREKVREGELKDSYEKQIDELRDSHKLQIENIKQLNKQQFEEQIKTIRDQMVSTSEKVLRQRQEELGEHNVEQVSKIIDPLQNSLKLMQKVLEDSRDKQNETMTRLDETIRLNTDKSQRLGDSAERLYKALTSEVKVQGNFGELQLRQLLENLGLKEGEQFTSQEQLRDKGGKLLKDDAGKGLIPDFILHFPNNRHVVVDSKMSFTSYERYMNCEDEEERRLHLKGHIDSMREQANRLARKQYSRFLPDGCNQLDFVIMYVNIEGALNLALSNDANLWRDAYNQGVLIFGSQTMFMNLRVLELMWRQVRQLNNQAEMVEAANQIVERVQLFAERFQDVDKKMRNVVEALNAVKTSTADSGKGIITAAKRLVKAGASENAKKKTLEQAEESVFIESDTTPLFLEQRISEE
ncbi:MAG: DNA recombination protein RmuC, partial [Bacteroidaceae bacterium]|nr:DNA recombination protein RmuC [Bacteroidaceae bacterium]